MLRATRRIPRSNGATVRLSAVINSSTPTVKSATTSSHYTPLIHSSRPSLARPLRSTSFPELSRLFSSSSIRKANFPFKLHDIGEGIAEVELLKWHVEVGQRVEEFDVLCEVQSDKSTVELTSPTVGVVKRLGAEEGVVVKVGELICDIEMEGEGTAETPLPEAEVEIEETRAAQAAQVEPAQQSAETSQPTTPNPEQAVPPVNLDRVETESTDLHQSSARDTSLFALRDDSLDNATSGAQFAGEAAMLPSAPPPPPTYTSGMAGETVRRRERRQDWESLKRIVKASPAVRTLAARMDVDLAEVKGTGDGGRVTSEDVRGHAGGSSSTTYSAAERNDQRPSSSAPRASIPATSRVEFGRTRKVMYRAMGDMGSVPHFGYSHTLNLTPLLPYMKTLNPPPSSAAKAPYLASDIPGSLVRDPLDVGERQKTTILTFLVKGLLLAMEQHPIMRSRVRTSGEGGERWLEISRDPNIAVAVSDPKYGLLTPSLTGLTPDASLSTITSHLTHLRQNASKPTPPGHVTISSVGPLGESRGAMPVLPPGGGVAICAVGRASWGMEWRSPTRTGEKRGVWDMTAAEVEAGGAEAVLRCPVGWSGDHRVLEGAELIAFTETWKKYIEEPWRWLKVDA